ncbi:glycosyltransferase [Tamlana sp. 62-3]|uniref:Glycosyltransferase n=1 Tax=Neotamlana sargassicola TaxID=2883125 RepID=A0A9X1I6J8_9FLAO|nr:glycosyltransferase [Tamlana sargassicola]MCB4807309.1 glycosyltransferase [Tamlana sargassicola]
MKIAIVYYCFNRINHTRKSFSKILNYRKDRDLFVFCDGFKENDDNGVKKVRAFIKKNTNSEEKIEVVFRDKNYGLAKNVIEGINVVFKKGYEGVIVLEDDCVPEESFFNYMQESLIKYKYQDKIKHISGFALPMKFAFEYDNYFTPYPCSWGWATWKKEWLACNFEDEAYYQQILNDKELKEKFDFSGKSFSHFLKLQTKGEINSWLIRWYAHIFKEKGLCSWASTSQIKNIGFDGTGEHKVSYDRFNQTKVHNKTIFKFDENFSCNLDVIREFRQHFMGPKIIDKIKTMIYLKTGIILDRKQK